MLILSFDIWCLLLNRQMHEGEICPGLRDVNRSVFLEGPGRSLPGRNATGKSLLTIAPINRTSTPKGIYARLQGKKWSKRGVFTYISVTFHYMFFMTVAP